MKITKVHLRRGIYSEVIKKKGRKSSSRLVRGLVSRLLGGLGGGGFCTFARGGRARRIAQGPNQIQLVKPNRVLGSRSLRLFQLEDELVVMLGVEDRIEPPQRSFILLSGIVQEVQIIVGFFKAGPILLNDLLESLGQKSPKPFHLCLKMVPLTFSVLLGLNCH